MTADCFQDYEEVVVPPAKPVPPKSTERLIPIIELDDLASGCFPVRSYLLNCAWIEYSFVSKGYLSLNRVQSIVYPTAYGSNENILVAGSPLLKAIVSTRLSLNLRTKLLPEQWVDFDTNSFSALIPIQGKTDVAMLTILRVIDQHRSRRQSPDVPIHSTIRRSEFKIIYVYVATFNYPWQLPTWKYPQELRWKPWLPKLSGR